MAHIYLDITDTISVFKFFLKNLSCISNTCNTCKHENVNMETTSQDIGKINLQSSNAGLYFVRVVLKGIEALVRAQLSFNAERGQSPGRDLSGDPGEVHADQGSHHVVPDRPPTQTPHDGVQVVEQLGRDVLGAHLEPLLDHRHGGQLHQAGHGAQSVPHSPGLSGGPELVGTQLQTLQSVNIKDQDSRHETSLIAGYRSLEKDPGRLVRLLSLARKCLMLVNFPREGGRHFMLFLLRSSVISCLRLQRKLGSKIILFLLRFSDFKDLAKLPTQNCLGRFSN